MRKNLTTAEHAHLLGLQQAVDAAKNERDAFVRFLANQHEVTPDGWNLDLGTGAWLASESSLRKIWDTPEEDEAWSDL